MSGSSSRLGGDHDKDLHDVVTNAILAAAKPSGMIESLHVRQSLDCELRVRSMKRNFMATVALWASDSSISLKMVAERPCSHQEAMVSSFSGHSKSLL